METAGWMGKLHAICEWITRLAYLNLLWIAFTLLGFVTAGILPSTIAMFSVVRKWLRQETEIPVFSTFWDVYKRGFWKANQIGLVLGLLFSTIAAGGLLLGSVSILFSGGAIGLLLLCAVMSLYVFPVYVHFDYTLRELFKVSFVLSASFPIQTITMAAAGGLSVMVALVFPAIGFLFFGSALSLAVMWLADGIFTKARAGKREQPHAAAKVSSIP